jgi:Spy/CpxP family protein refolding chaperone
MSLKHVAIGSTIAAALLAGALTIPTHAQPARGNAERSWRAENPQSPSKPEARGRGQRGERPERPSRPDAPPAGHHAGPGPAGIPGLPDAGFVLRPFWENERLAEKLALTDSQRDALLESRNLAIEGLKASDGSIRTAAEALRAELEKDNPDLDTATALYKGVVTAVEEKGRLILGHAVTVKTILTPEQEEVLREARPSGPGRPGEGRGPWAGGPGRGEGNGPIAEMEGLRDDIREILQNSGTLDDVQALLTERGIPAPAQKRILEQVRKRLEAGSATK